MKKLIALATLTTLALPLFAQQAAPAEATPAAKEAARDESPVWPAYFALAEYPASPDVIGLRVTIPYSTRQQNVTGIDVGLWGRCLYFEGLQINVLRNDVKDTMAGFQVGLCNSIGRGDLAGIQAGLWNESQSIVGVQCGLVNVTGSAEGFQVGLINRCETMHGFQVGLVNIIRDAEAAFLPICNVGF